MTDSVSIEGRRTDVSGHFSNVFSTPGMRESITVLSLTPFRLTMLRIFSCSSSKST